MKRFIFFPLMLLLLFSINALAATQQEIQQSIDNGLAYLTTPGVVTLNGDEAYWSYTNNGTLAATASAALAFVEAGYLPGNDVVINGVNYGDIVGMACNYIFNLALIDDRFTSEGPGGMETAGYTRYAEDYNSDGILNDGGNNQAIYFDPGLAKRGVYTTGIVVPLVYALGKALGEDTVIGMGMEDVTAGLTYRELLRDIIDWFSWGQVEPNRGNQRGGWRYDANYSTSDNSTAQWPALAIIYGSNWGLPIPQYVRDELKLWTDYIQNENGGSGYSDDSTYVNVSKTGGLLLQFFTLGYDIGADNSHSPYNNIGNEVDAAINFISSRWNTTPSSTWYGNLNHPYAMWAVYKALQIYGFLEDTNFYPGDDAEFVIGKDIPSAPGGFDIGQEGDIYQSVPGDWYSHYCDYLVSIQHPNGSWNGYEYWTGALAVGWYINILKATPVTLSVNPTPQNVRIMVAEEAAFLSWTCDNVSDQVYFQIKYREKGTGPYEYFRDQYNDIKKFQYTSGVISGLTENVTYEFIVKAIVDNDDINLRLYESEPVEGRIPAVWDINLNHPLLLIPGTGGGAESWDAEDEDDDDMRIRLERLGITYGGTLKLGFIDQLQPVWKGEDGDEGVAPGSIGDFYIAEYNEEADFNPCGPIAKNYTPTRLFVDEIREIEKDITGMERRLILAGQSLGGLRARAYLQKKVRDEGDKNVTEKVNGLVTIGTPNLGVLQDHKKYEDTGLEGAWQIMLGNADEDENEFFPWAVDWLFPKDKKYDFVGGYINDEPERYDMNGDGQKDYGKNKYQVVGFLKSRRSAGWDFNREALQNDVIAGSDFLKGLNFWIESDCSDGESKDCSFSIKDGCEDGSCNDASFNHLPNIYYRYLVGKNAEGKPKHLLSFLLRDWKWYNYFMYKDQNEGDGFISTISQNFMPYHLNKKFVDMSERPGKSHQDELLDHIGLLEAIGFKVLKISVFCPVDILVESPSGLVQSRSRAEMPGATYNEADIDGDGDLDRFIEIPFPEQGEYKITVTPKPGAAPGQTYTLEIEQDGDKTIIRDNEPIDDLVGIPETVYVNVTPMANAGPDQTFTAETNGTAQVTFDGSGSSDPGSTPGTNDDIVRFEWFNEETKIGEGEIDTIALGEGEYQITLLVTDRDGATDTDTCMVTVSPPELILSSMVPPYSKVLRRGAIIPVKFSLVTSEDIDPGQPFYLTEKLEVRIYDSANSLLQTSTYGQTVDYDIPKNKKRRVIPECCPEGQEYCVDVVKEYYLTNFQSKRAGDQYRVEVWHLADNMKIGEFLFKTR